MRILIVDDDLALVSMLASHFQIRGWDVEGVNSGSAAAKRINAGGIDLVLSDLRMPDGTGIELLRKFRSDPEAPPFIVMTGMMDQGRDYLKKLGAKEILLKPFDIGKLLVLAKQLASAKPGTRHA